MKIQATLVLVALWGLTSPQALPAVSFDSDEALLAQYNVRPTNEGLLRLLKEHSPRAAPERLEEIAARLGSRDFAARQDASTTLVAAGPVALPILQRVLRQHDPEAARRAESCIAKIEEFREHPVALAAVRLLLDRRPPGTAAALLSFAAGAPDEETATAIWFGLDELVARDADARSALVSSLAAPWPTRRALSGFLLARRGDSAQHSKARRLLSDPESDVRLRTAQGLLAAGDASAIPTLIDLLNDDNVLIAWQAEELLRWAAGRRAPAGMVGTGTPATRSRCQGAWRDWWKTAARRFSLDEALQRVRQPGLYLTHTAASQARAPTLAIIGHDRSIRYEIGLPADTVDAHLLPTARFLVATRSGHVLEYAPDGTPAWQATCQLPQGARTCERLPNGATRIAGRVAVAQIAPDGAVTFDATNRVNVEFPEHPCVLPSGDIIGASRAGRFEALVLFDPVTRRARARIALDTEFPAHNAPRIERLANGNFLLSGAAAGLVREVDTAGKRVRDLPAPMRQARHWRDQVVGAGGFQHAGYICQIGPDNVVTNQCFLNTSPNFAEVCLGLIRLGFTPPVRTNAELSALRFRTDLASHDPLVRAAALTFVPSHDLQASQAAPLVLNAFDDPDREVRRAAGGALMTLYPASKRYIVAATKDPRPRVRAGAVAYLAPFRGDPDLVLPLWSRALHDADPRVRRSAVGPLGLLAQHDERAIRLLAAALDDRDAPNASTYPGRSIAAADSDQPVCVAHAAAIALAGLGPRAQPAVPALCRALSRNDDKLQALAAVVLGRIGPAARSAIPHIVAALRAPSADESARERRAHASYVRASLIAALGKLHADTKEVRALLTDLANDPNPQVRGEADGVLKQLKP